MSKLSRAAATSQTLSLVAMEEASRLGLREADLEHLLLALVVSDQPAGVALRAAGITLVDARAAVGALHDEQLASLGIHAGLPAPGRIVFHETGGYEWSRRASDLIGRAAGRGRAGDAAAVLRELLAEPSGLVGDLLDRLGTTARTVLAELDRAEEAPRARATRQHAPGTVSGASDTFVPAPVAVVWALVSDPPASPSGTRSSRLSTSSPRTLGRRREARQARPCQTLDPPGRPRTPQPTEPRPVRPRPRCRRTPRRPRGARSRPRTRWRRGPPAARRHGPTASPSGCGPSTRDARSTSSTPCRRPVSHGGSRTPTRRPSALSSSRSRSPRPPEAPTSRSCRPGGARPGGVLW